VKYFSGICLSLVILSLPTALSAQFTRQDTLRGSITPQRAWWDVIHYDVTVTPDYESKTISGRTTIQYKVLAGQKTDYLQVDLQKPLMVDTIFYDGKLYINYPPRPYFNDGNAWLIPLPKAQVNSIHSVTIAYHGKPREAVNPPWDGGWIWKKDEKERPWMSVACQGLGASVWYPCKDHQSDEPDNGARLTIIVPNEMKAIGNGRLSSKKEIGDGKTAWTWEVKSPINN
jgi:aminopeptidase N